MHALGGKHRRRALYPALSSQARALGSIELVRTWGEPTSPVKVRELTLVCGATAASNRRALKQA